MKILVADDSATLRERLVRMLLGISGVRQVGEAGNVREALEAVESLKPDLALLDIQMPGGNGMDVLRVVKQKSPSTIVIMLTNYPYLQYPEKCLELGAEYFLSKSKDSSELLDLIERLAVTERKRDE